MSGPQGDSHSADEREQARHGANNIQLVVADIPATNGVTQLSGNAVQTVGQAAGQDSRMFARSIDDFNVFPDKSKQEQRNFTLAEVRQCTGQSGGCLYVVYNGLVLDLIDFAPFHPGSPDTLRRHGGTDASAAMRAAGMPAAVFDVFLKRFVVGRLVPAAPVSQAPPPSSPPARAPATRACGLISSLMGFC